MKFSARRFRRALVNIIFLFATSFRYASIRNCLAASTVVVPPGSEATALAILGYPGEIHERWVEHVSPAVTYKENGAFEFRSLFSAPPSQHMECRVEPTFDSGPICFP